MTNNFWIPVMFSSEETKDRLERAIVACHRVHVFTVQTLNDYFLDHAENYRYVYFRRELNLFLKDEMPFKHGNNLLQQAQRYSLVRAAEKSFPYFSENKKFIGKKFIRVDPIKSGDYNSIQIETRKIWKKYLALNGLITTAYGTIFLADEWNGILEGQAKERSIPFEMIPYLWHSITLCLSVEEARLRFNLHEINSKFSRKPEKEMER